MAFGNLGNIFGAIGSGLAKAATNYATSEKKKKTSTPTSTPSTPSYNEHQQYIQDTHPGGYDTYTKGQQDRYNTAFQNKDYDLLQKLDQDALRVGYNLSMPQQQMPQMPQQQMPDYSQQMNDLLSAVQGYESNMPNMPYPDMGDYKFNDIQKQLGNLTNQLQGYEGANYMNMDEAIARANSQLGGMYSQSLDKSLDAYNKSAISRGMFGQMPVEALKQNAIAENELDKSNAINSLGANLHSNDFNQAQTVDQNYYNQINQLAGLLGQQYNTELGQYQSDVSQYTNLYNQGRQQDQDYFDNISRQLELLGTQQNLQNNEISKYTNTIGQFSNDYMAEINKIQGDNDPSNDWQIAYLQDARNQKIAGQGAAQSDSQNQTYKQAMDMFGKLGYASGWVAQALGLPEGTTTASYSKSLSSGSGSGSGSSGGEADSKPPVDLQELTQQARLMASSMFPDGYTQDQLNEVISSLYEFWETGDIKVLNKIKSYIPSRSPDTNAGQGDEELFEWLQDTTGNSWKDDVPFSQYYRSR